MFCVGCGKEIPDDSKVCMYCGTKLEETNTSAVHMYMPEEKKKKKRFLPVLLIGVAAVIIFLVLMGFGESNLSKAEEKIVNKLFTFTDWYKDENNAYLFLDDTETWAIRYTEKNESIIFENSVIEKCFTNGLGEGCLDEESSSSVGFAYDIDENAARIYFDAEVADGHLSIVSYDFDDEEYVLSIDGKKYEASDAFMEMVDEYDLAQSMKADLEAFKELLNKHDLTLDDLLKVRYETLDENFVPEEEE